MASNLLVLGINHESAPVALRERVAFVPEEMPVALAEGLSLPGVAELAILSTCNRTELYVVEEQGRGSRQDRDTLMQWLCAYHGLPIEELASCCYSHRGDDALGHMIRVAAGLDSLVLGEPQIFGQFKSAYAVAREAGAAGSELARLFAHVFAVAKQIRTETAIGENPVSVAYAAVGLTRHIFADLSRCRALLIGAGDTIQLVARHLRDRGVARIVIANRTLERAGELAREFSAEAVLLSEIPAQLADADIVVASTASQLPILGKGAVEAALKKRKHRPILMVDIAVPRDIEPQVGDLSDVYLYTVDDLREIVEENRRARQSEVSKADQIVEQGVARWRERARAGEAVDILRDFRAKAESLRDTELDKARRLLQRGEDPERVLEQLARGLTNKLIHSPSTELRQAGAKGESELIDGARRLFQLGKSDDDGQEEEA